MDPYEKDRRTATMSKQEARASLLAGSAGMGSDRGRDITPFYEPYVGGYHEREGMYTTMSYSKKERTPWFYIPNTKWTWSFLILVFVQAVVVLALESYVFARFQFALEPDAKGRPVSKTVPTYLSLFIFGVVYQLILTYDALRMKNTIQVIGLCLYNIGLLIEAAVQSDQINDAVTYSDPQVGEALIYPWFFKDIRPYYISVPCIIAACTGLMGFVAWKLYDEFSWSIYKNISADLKLKRRYLTYQIYIALLKFDFFFFLAFTVQFLVVVIKTDDAEFYITIAAIPVTVILLMLAALWTREESILGMLIILIIYFAALAYFVFKLVRIYYGNLVTAYRPAAHSLTTFAIITIILLLVTIVFAIICTHNFDKGLKPHVSSRAKSRRRRGTSVDIMQFSNDVPMSAGGTTRMTID